MKTLTETKLINDIEAIINDMQNKAYYETEDGDYKSKYAIYESNMVNVSAALSVLKDVINGENVIKK